MAPTLASQRKLWLRLDVYSEDHQNACVFEESSLRGPEPQFQSFTIVRGWLQWERGASPCDYLNSSIYGFERSRVSFIHDFGGCGVNVEIFDRTVQGCSTVIDQLDKTYLPIVFKVLRKVMETPWYARGGTLLAGYIRSAMAQNCAGQMREDLFAPFRRYEVNLAAERGVGLSDVALIRNQSLQYRRMLMEEDLMTGLAWDHLKADVQLVRYSGLGLSDESIINPMTNSDGMDKNRAGKRKEDLFGPKDNLAVGVGLSDITFTGHGGGGLALQRGAGMYQSTNPLTNPELCHSPEAIQRGDGGNSQGLSDITFTGHGGGVLGLALQRGAGMYQSTNPLTNPELYHSPEAIQRGDGGNSQGLSDITFTGHGGGGLALQRGAGMYQLYHSPEAIQRGDGGNSQDGAPVEGAVVHKTHGMKLFDSLVTAGKDVYSSLASLGVSLNDLESQGADIPVLERIYHLLSEHDQTFQHWIRDAGTVGASFSAVYASPSLTTQLPAAVAFFTILTAMWVPRKRTRTKTVLTKFGALACIAGVMSAMVKYLSPVGMAIAGPLFLIPAGVVVLA